MGHDQHFLTRLSRVDADQADRALALYRDPELVRGLLAAAKLTDFERAALPIDEGELAPHLIVARNGHFVTCLGPGMFVGDAPLVPWPLVRRSLDELRAAEVVEKSEPEQLADRFERVHRGGADVAREEMRAVCAVVPLLRKDTFISWCERVRPYARDLGALQRLVKKGRAKPADLRKLWVHRWELAHRAVTLLVADPACAWLREHNLHNGISQLFFCIDGPLGGFMPTAARFVWAAAQLGEALVDELLALRTKTDYPGVAAMAGLSLSVIAVRNPDERKAIRAALAQPSTRSDEVDEGRVSWDDARRIDARLVSLLEAPRSTWDAFVHKTGAWALERLRREVGNRAEMFPAENLLALSLAVTAPGKDPAAWLTGLVGFVPALATAEALDLYLPRAWMPETHFDPEWMRTLVGRSTWVQDPPKHAEPTPGRNEPCSCGSGKKWKRCCGARA